MKKILLSAFSCSPLEGSEPSYGWHWSIGLAGKGFEVHTITRTTNRKHIESSSNIENLNFHYLALPLGLEYLYSYSQATMYLYYILWQWMAYRLAKKLQRIHSFHRVHHVSWGSIQQGSFLYKLGVPFIFGPTGGGQVAPSEFKNYFLSYWRSEVKREIVSSLLIRFNPGCRNMLKKASLILVSNKETEVMALKNGAQKVIPFIDAALPPNFFPKSFVLRSPQKGKLKLLWVGRFLPRKGLMLVLEVMNELRNHGGITLTIVGDGEMRKAVYDKIKEWQLQSSIHLVGVVAYENVREYYLSHEAFLFTSLRDSCPLQLIEAMAYNLPIITLDLHGQGQIVTSETGIKITLSDPKTVVKELATAIIDLSNNPRKYQDLSMSAYEFAREQMWDDKINDTVKRFY